MISVMNRSVITRGPLRTVFLLSDWTRLPDKLYLRR